MKRVLWISRHEMTTPQREDLERVMGQPVDLIRWSDTVERVEDLGPAVEQADVVAAVLPPELLSQLLKLAKDKPVIQSVAGRVPTGRFFTLADGRQEPEFAFAHRCWQQILSLEMKIKNL